MTNQDSLLEKNITSTIYEGLLKLGHNNNEPISIYYDLDLLNHLLSTSFTSNEDCLQFIDENFSFHTLSEHIRYSLEKGRFRFTVFEDGISLIYKEYEKDNYLKELIQLVRSHDFTLDDVLAIFSNSNYEYILETSNNEEFQHVIYLKDDSIDPYRYCFTFDQMGGYYHRLLAYDYNKL